MTSFFFFFKCAFEYPPKCALTALAWLVPHETAANSAQVLCTPYNHDFMQSHIYIYIHKVYACLAVTCHLHIWQNDRDFLHATAVTQGWNGYRNKSQHRKLTLEKKILSPPLQGFKQLVNRCLLALAFLELFLMILCRTVSQLQNLCHFRLFLFRPATVPAYSSPSQGWCLPQQKGLGLCINYT